MDYIHKEDELQSEDTIDINGNKVVITIRNWTDLTHDCILENIDTSNMNMSYHSESETCSMKSESDLEGTDTNHSNLKAVDMPSAKQFASSLYHLDGFKLTDISKYLLPEKEYNKGKYPAFFRESFLSFLKV